MKRDEHMIEEAAKGLGQRLLRELPPGEVVTALARKVLKLEARIDDLEQQAP